MKDKFDEILKESIRLELNISNLYFLFHKEIIEDSDFWWALVLEEKNHASLLRNCAENFKPVGRFPPDIIADTLEDIITSNKRIENMIDKFEKSPPSRNEAFEAALEIENSAGEMHFQQFMTTESKSSINKIFNQLNKDDKNHSHRIREYMEKNNL